ncbi:hypothetical protein D3C84_1149650 [compost metagenome]
MLERRSNPHFFDAQCSVRWREADTHQLQVFLRRQHALLALEQKLEVKRIAQALSEKRLA